VTGRSGERKTNGNPFFEFRVGKNRLVSKNMESNFVKVFKEIVSTEETYVTTLRELSLKIIAPFRDQPFCKDKDKHPQELFSNIESLFSLHDRRIFVGELTRL
jgi:hypothetical protein